jgi:predicted ArsR family transcriptional regulator
VIVGAGQRLHRAEGLEDALEPVALMAEAITAAAAQGSPVTDALRDAARAAGRALGEQAVRHTEGRASAADRYRAVSDVLAGYGYEPRVTPDGVILANCPFHRLAESYTDLVCGMNLDLVDGLLDVLGPACLRARLDPAPGRCCVTLGSMSNTG